jgi:hypothetical protein
MTLVKVLTIFLFAALAISCNDIPIAGTWRPADLPKYPTNANNYNDSLGDLVISPDSTFLFKGAETPDTPRISGFVYGGSLKGTWTRPDAKHIIFLPDNVDKKFSAGFTFTIFTLDKRELVMGAAFPPTKVTPRTFIRQ